MGMVERTGEFMHKMKQKGIVISKIRLDLTSKNRTGKSSWECVTGSVGFEFTSWDTPQQKNVAELAFPYWLAMHKP